MYLAAETVVLDYITPLEAVEDYLQGIVKVGAVAAEIHVNVELEAVGYVRTPKGTLIEKVPLIVLRRFCLAH